MKKLLLGAMLLLVCGSAYGARVTTSVDSFDGATRIEADAYGTECSWTAPCPMIGARWVSSAESGYAVLVVKFSGDYIQIRSIKLNIDGAIVDLPAGNSQTIFTIIGGSPVIPGIIAGVPGTRTSVRDFLIPLSMIDQILAAQSVKIRVDTETGIVDSIFSGGKRKVNRAYETLQEFAATVAAKRNVGQTRVNAAVPAPAASEGQTNTWWNQQKPAQPAPTRYRCTDADGKPYVSTTAASGCVVE